MTKQVAAKDKTRKVQQEQDWSLLRSQGASNVGEKKSTNNAIVTLSHDGRMAPKAYQSWESIKQTKLIMHSLHPLADQVLNFPVSM